MTEKTEYAYFEGKFVPLEEANISIKTHAFLYGTSVFEGIRGYYLKDNNSVSIFRMKEHYERMLGSSRVFYLTPEKTVNDLIEITEELVRLNQPETDIYIRPTLYKTGLNITPNLEATVTEFCLWTHPLGEYLDLSKGLNVCVSSWRRLSDNQIPPRCKAGGAYMNTALAVTDARSMGFDDAIFLKEDGTVSEGSAMNLFLIRNGKLITPSKNQHILEGITRDSVLTLGKNELELEVLERAIDRTELYFADEAFFCGTGAQIAPITKIDGRPVGNGNVGPITKKLQDLYFQVVKNKVLKYGDWCHTVDLSKVSTNA